MTWGGLNPALTSWRNGLQARFPHRGTQSDGGYADKLHGSTSEHQADKDGTVDAFDCDVNFLGSSEETGTPTERRIAEAVKADFEDDERAQLWIHQREIANADVQDWLERDYHGPSPHDHHIHFQSRQSHERDGRPWAMPRTDALLRELNGDEDDMDQKTFDARMDAWWAARMDPKAPDNNARKFLRVAPWHQVVGRGPKNAHDTLFGDMRADLQKAAGTDDVDEGQIAQLVLAGLSPTQIAEAVVAAMPADQAKQIVDELSARLTA